MTNPQRRPRRLPRVYFAGRMNLCSECEGGDWRRHIVGYDILPDGMEHEVGPDTAVEFAGFIYGGPFVVDQSGGHTTGHGDDFNDAGERRRIFEIDRYQIHQADLFLAYVADLQAFGTLVEIGIAHGMRKPIILGLGDKLTENDCGELWFAREAATQVYHGSPEQFWTQVKTDWIGRAMSDIPNGTVSIAMLQGRKDRPVCPGGHPHRSQRWARGRRLGLPQH